ncbi:hypothetical protein JCM30566_07730 [Marinitoga arctica]
MKKILVLTILMLSIIMFGEYMSILDVNIKDYGTRYKIIPYKELIKNNGKNGNDSFIAVSGFVYDVTYSKPWENGYHEGNYAGSELTFEMLRLSPHGVSKLNNIDQLGILSFTINDLIEFNGRNGSKAYVAVDGIVYDVSHSKLWKDGEHKGRHEAGNELTYEIRELSPHGIKKLDNVFPIGILTLTMEELKKFNGKNGNKAYVAVDGMVYDVSNSKLWKDGEHKGRHEAGNELTYEIRELSPHGVKKLDNVFMIGYLVLDENELRTFNGKNGNKAYVSYKDIVYDVTKAKKWKNGEHKNGIKAGMILDEVFGTSPHDESIFSEKNKVFMIGYLIK